MRQWIDAIPALVDALTQNFPKADAEEINVWANELYDRISVANSLERLERGDTRSLDDIGYMKAAVRNLRLAADKLDKVGWHGGKSLTEFAKQICKMNEELPGAPLMDAMDSNPYLADFLRGFADQLRECVDKIDPRVRTH